MAGSPEKQKEMHKQMRVDPGQAMLTPVDGLRSGATGRLRAGRLQMSLCPARVRLWDL